MDQTLIVFDFNRKSLTEIKLDEDKLEKFTSIEWLLEDIILAVYSSTGRILLYDAALNPIESSYATRSQVRFSSMCTYLNEKLVQKNPFKLLSSSRIIVLDSLWCFFTFSNGPMGVFRIRLPQNFNNIALMTHYIKNSQIENLQDRYIEAAVNLMNQLDWDRDGYATLSCFYKLMNFLLSIEPQQGKYVKQ